MSTEEKLKSYILSRYKSIREFVAYTDLPYSTVDSVLRRGVLNSGIDNVLRICAVLNISADELAKGNITPVRKELTSDKNEPVEINHIAEIYRYKLEKPEAVLLDNTPLTEHEAQFVIDSIDIIIEQLRKNRKRNDVK